MKKFLCILLSVLLTMSLWACSSDEDVRGEITTDPTDPQFSLGTTANNTYKNDYLGLSCTLPSDWVFYTDEQIRELNNFVGDMAGDDFQDAVENAEVIQDMYASYQGGLATVNVTLQKLSALQLAGINLKAVLEAQFPTIKQALENMGCTNVQLNYGKITINGKEYDGATVSASVSGIPIYETLVSFVRGRYYATVTVCTLQNDDTANLLNQFTFS